MTWTHLEVRDYATRVRQWRATWGLYDDPLKGICRAHPGHGQLDATVAKVGLIQRAYEAGLERHVFRDEDGGGVLTVARRLHASNRRIDGELAALRRVVGRDEPLERRSR